MPDATVGLKEDSLLFQRAVGRLVVSFKPRGPETVLDDLRQEGCLRARFPRRLTPGWLDLVTLNTSGGIAGGDRLDLQFAVAPCARATITAQAAERFYRRAPGSPRSMVRTSISIASGAMAEWLPQETILFDNSGLDRRLDVTLTGDARFLGVESWIFGRTAMGETVRTGSLRDVIQVRRDGRRLLHDALRLEGPIEQMLQRPAVASGHRAIGTIIYVASDAAVRLAALRAVLQPGHDSTDEAVTPPRAQPPPDIEAAASAWNGMLIARIVAADGGSLRRAVIGLLPCLRDGRPLPRTWNC